MILKKIGVLSLAKVYGSLMAIMGLILGLVMALVYLGLSTSTGAQLPPGMMPYSLFGLWSIIFVPIFYGFLGFAAGAFTAWLFNLLTKYTGGIELELDKK